MANPNIPISGYPTFGKPKEGINYVERPGAYGFLPDADGKIAIIETTFGFFLPGGGIEAGEDAETALKRELDEEIGYILTSTRLVSQAAQFHYSKHYQTHFKKVGTFFQIQAVPLVPNRFQDEHQLVWWDTQTAAKKLSQEFQRWAVSDSLGRLRT